MIDWKLELVQVSLSDVDREKVFCTEKMGFNDDHGHRVNGEVRFVQQTPPGSACSVAIGTGISDMKSGSVQGLQPVVSDIGATRRTRRVASKLTWSRRSTWTL